jgi:putative ubiquitin-RnfH superfamily antitoxin RatB of RatAB toxin-antitoxin module
MKITLVHAPAARTVASCELELPEGSTVTEALLASGWLERFPDGQGGLDRNELAIGIWGRKASPGTVLRDRDRIELCRPLRVDPKVARRERFGQQGARTAGLFARRRPGARPGY